jgi:hypothetical protein
MSMCELGTDLFVYKWKVRGNTVVTLGDRYVIDYVNQLFLRSETLEYANKIENVNRWMNNSTQFERINVQSYSTFMNTSTCKASRFHDGTYVH